MTLSWVGSHVLAPGRWWSWSLPLVQCHEPLFIVIQSLYQIESLESICHFHYIIIRNLIWIIPEWFSGFPYFHQDRSEFCNKEFMIWASSRSCFFWLYRASPPLAIKNIINLISILTIWWGPCVFFSCVIGGGCFLWQVFSLGKILLALALLHFVLKGQIWLLLQVSPDFLLLHSNPL